MIAALITLPIHEEPTDAGFFELESVKNLFRHYK